MSIILEINTTNYASTGNIMLNIAKLAREENFEVYTACKASKESYKYSHKNQIFIGNRIERVISSKLCTITGLRDHFNFFGTLRFINRIKKINPDLIHLHVLHDDFVNIKILFNYLSKLNIPIIWTFHDLNALTGKCPYFDIVKCDKWKRGCFECPQLHTDVKSCIDQTKYIWKLKKRLFTSISNLTITTPSNWLKSMVEQSFFKNYPVITINNGINMNDYSYIESNIKEKLNIDNKYMVLGVANLWNKRKGLDIFIELAKILPSNYQIVLVGTNKDVDSILPSNIISIDRTYDKNELIKLYSAADVFVNPTREEVFGLVNIESLVCGTPVIMFNTGGSVETINNDSGIVVEKDDINSLYHSIVNVCENKPFNKNSCIEQARTFDESIIYRQYLDLYKEKLSIK